MTPPTQAELFGPAPQTLPEGFHYRLDFISHSEEAELLAALERMPLDEARYKTPSAADGRSARAVLRHRLVA